jgi:integrase
MGSIKKRILSDGSIVYDCRIHRRGLGTVSKTFKKKDEAERWSNGVESKIDRGESVSRKADKTMFVAACAEFLQHYKPLKGKEKEITPGVVQVVQRLAYDFKPRAISQITNQVIQAWIDEFLNTEVATQERKIIHPYYNAGLDKDGNKRKYSEGTVRRHFFVLKKVLEWYSVRENFILPSNLFLQIRVPRAWAGKRRRRLEAGELELLHAAALKGYDHKVEWPLLIDFAVNTAARSQEIIKAKWSDLNLEGRSWAIPPENVKTATFRTVPLSKKSLTILEKMDTLKKSGDDRIFHMWRDSATVSKGFRRLTVRAGVDDFRFHDLRHEGVSRLFETTDLTDSEIMSITGHTSSEMLKAYSALRPNALARRLDGERR